MIYKGAISNFKASKEVLFKIHNDFELEASDMNVDIVQQNEKAIGLYFKFAAFNVFLSDESLDFADKEWFSIANGDNKK